MKIQSDHFNLLAAHMKPFSVLISVYHRDDAALFEVALQSIFDNTLRPNEVLLIQDGAVTFELKCVIDYFEENYGLKTIALKKNQGLASALNFGLKHIENEFIFRADADDINDLHRFEKQLPLLVQGYDLVGSAVREIDGQGREIAVRRPPVSCAEIRSRCRYRSPFNHMTVCYRKSVVVACGGYPKIHLKEDYGLWAKVLAKQYNCINLEDALVKASAGHSMYKRRGGVAYVRSELQMQRLLVQCGLQGWVGGILVGLARSLVFSAPANVRGWFYQTFLRHKK